LVGSDAQGADVGTADPDALPSDAVAPLPDGGLLDDSGTMPGPDATPIVPDKPPDLIESVAGTPSSTAPAASGPALIFVGGGTNPDDAFQWAIQFLSGGNAVVLESSGTSDALNSYLYSTIGGVASVDTMTVNTATMAATAYVLYRVSQANLIVLDSNSQTEFLKAWKGTPLVDAIQARHRAGAVLAGIGAAASALPHYLFDPAGGTITSAQALANPYDPRVQIEHDFIRIPSLEAVIVDAHFKQRDRFGRLFTFMARILQDQLHAPPLLGIGVDENTALAIGPDGTGTVFGGGGVYPILGQKLPDVAVTGTPLTWSEQPYMSLTAGATFRPSDFLNAPIKTPTVSATAGALSPNPPY
jgi:cyanophycinase-like exopeptidase